jgi:hypothetical protein
MNEKQPPPPPHAWLAPVVVALVAAQLGLTWLQGSLLHRQHQDIQGIREDLQTLAESLEQGAFEAPMEEGGLVPARSRHPRHPRRSPVRVAYISPSEDEPEKQAAKDLEDARKSAQKAVKDSREVQGKLSFEENARKAEEKAKLQGAQAAWQKWLWLGLGAGLLAIVVRSWMRRRG